MSKDDSVPALVRVKLRVLEHLPREGDASLIVLKGHLLIEELLYSLVSSAATFPAALEDGRLSFLNVASVAKALFFEEREAHYWEAIFALNALRNAFAHNLDPPKREEQLRRFGTAMARGNPKGGEETVARPEDSLVMGVSILCGMLAAIEDRSRGGSAAEGEEGV